MLKKLFRHPKCGIGNKENGFMQKSYLKQKGSANLQFLPAILHLNYIPGKENFKTD